MLPVTDAARDYCLEVGADTATICVADPAVICVAVAVDDVAGAGLLSSIASGSR